MTDCLFCKIAKGEIPSQKVYENDKVFCFLDIRPINKGHTLVIHKHHHMDIFDTPEEDMKDLIVAAKKIAIALKSAFNPDGINIGMNNGEAAGQKIFHAHLHVIPRWSDDGLRHWPGKEVSNEELEADAAKIRETLS